MLLPALIQFALFAAITIVLMLPFGAYLAGLLTDEDGTIKHLVAPLEKPLFWLAGMRTKNAIAAASYDDQNWKQYLGAALVFNAIGFAVLFLIVMHQAAMPLNPQNLPNVPFALAFNIAASFVTNTDWQAYAGESTLSMFSQMIGLAVQNFLSAATGIAVAGAAIRGFTRRETPFLGNFYADVTRVTLFLLLPLALIFALFLVTQGVPQNVLPPIHATAIDGGAQTIPQGPVASQIAIKMLGSNGGGYFNANGAHPYENPSPLSNLAELVSLLLLPAAMVVAFGRLVRDRRQGWVLLAVMAVLFVALTALCATGEMGGSPVFTAANVDQVASDTNPGGNMEGKEVRFGTFNSALWASATTATSNGSTVAAHDSLMPVGGAVTLFNMLLGGVIFGGVGCGLYGILIYVLIAVFIAGLMVGRTPEYLGKKIEAHEIKLAVLTQLLYPVCVLGFGMLALLLPQARVSISGSGPHGFTQAIYAYASAVANNGSAFAGFDSNTDYQNYTLGIVMLIGRFGVIVPVLAIAGSLSMKKSVPPSPGTMPTHGIMFGIVLLAAIVMFGGLTYFPVMALGPLAEHLNLFPAGAP